MRHGGGATRGGRDSVSARQPIGSDAVPLTLTVKHNAFIPRRAATKMAVEIQLINEIEKHELLYNFGLPQYNRKDLVEEAWEEIAASTNMSSKYCVRATVRIAVS